jgi:hypothetical protein
MFRNKWKKIFQKKYQDIRNNYLVQRGWSDILPCDPIISVTNYGCHLSNEMLGKCMDGIVSSSLLHFLSVICVEFSFNPLLIKYVASFYVSSL